MPNLDVCQTGTHGRHVPYENPIRPLHHGIKAVCHRCKAPVWWDSDTGSFPGSSRWRSHKIVEWP